MARKKTKGYSAEDNLYDVRKQMSELREIEKKLVREVMEDFTTSGKRRGDHFTVAQKQTLKVVEPEAAFTWAAERGCITVDTTKAMKILRREFEIPEFFEIRKTDYLRMAGQPTEINSGDDS